MNAEITKIEKGFSVHMNNETYTLEELTSDHLTRHYLQDQFKLVGTSTDLLSDDDKHAVCEALKQCIEIENSFIILFYDFGYNKMFNHTSRNGWVEMSWFERSEIVQLKRRNNGPNNKIYLLEKQLK